MGQFLPPSFVAAMEELASTPDAKARNRYQGSFTPWRRRS
jgi:hypothetical protein